MRGDSARTTQRSLVDQSELTGQRPVVVNNMNIPKPAAGEPTLLTFDETETLFHEFGHALHGLLARVRYPSQAGTNVFRDFVELPSQVNELWMLRPEVLGNYAVHHETGERMPQELVDRLIAARGFNQGFETAEYLAAAVLDQAWHRVGAGEHVTDVAAFEPYAALIASELNVKAVRLETVDEFTAANPVERKLSVNARAAGPRIGKDVQRAIAGARPS